MKLHFQFTLGSVFQDCDVTMWPSPFIHISWKHAALKLVINSSMLLTFQFSSVHIYMYQHKKCIYICAPVCVRARVCVYLLHGVCVLLVCS